jgi:DNA-binding transcriptional ArsR family regulator
MTTIPMDTPTAPAADPTVALVAFFKSLSDVHRLQVAGRLAAGNQTVAQLAEALGEPPAAIRRHLDALVEADLVAGPLGPTQTYRLRRDHMQALAAQVLTRPAAVVPPTEDEFAAKVLRDFLTPEGTFRELPAQEKKFVVLLRLALQAFTPGQRYTEKEVNEALRRLHPDTATLRRAMIDRRWMQREPAGGSYWRA